jgi:hypothetical protein
VIITVIEELGQKVIQLGFNIKSYRENCWTKSVLYHFFIANSCIVLINLGVKICSKRQKKLVVKQKNSNNFLVEGKKGAREGSELAFLTF